MTLTLRSRRPSRFSETARSWRHSRRKSRPRCRHLEAIRRLDRRVPGAIVRRRLADDVAERPAEGAQAGKSDVEADVGDAAVGLAQQEHRALNPPPLQVTVRRLAEDGT